MQLENLIKKKPDEKLVFYLRRHPIVFIGQTFFILLIGLAPFALGLLGGSFTDALLEGPATRPLLILILSGYYLCLWLVFLTQFVDYYLDAWIVTTDKIVNVEQHGLFSRTISELDLAKVQDVTSEVKGVLPTFLNYGNIRVQTAGEEEHFVFEQVHKPHEIRKQLLDLVEADRKRQGETV
ncbi:PH domain-containing protein [Candidatus Uhrbacteria bacterium]|nr:PH domain-containing protein [Candidatus Uhrbacteria bacterium]